MLCRRRACDGRHINPILIKQVVYVCVCFFVSVTTSGLYWFGLFAQFRVVVMVGGG